MKRYDVIELIEENDSVHGAFEPARETVRTTFCEVRSATRNEAYQAMAIGMNVSVVFVLTVEADYANEKELYYNGTRYRVVRTYVSDDGIELSCEVHNG